MEIQTVTYQPNRSKHYSHDYSLMIQKIVVLEKGLDNLNVYLRHNELSELLFLRQPCFIESKNRTCI